MTFGTLFLALGAGFLVGLLAAVLWRLVFARRERQTFEVSPASGAQSFGRTLAAPRASLQGEETPAVESDAKDFFRPVPPTRTDTFEPAAGSHMNSLVSVCAPPCWICGLPRGGGAHNH